MSAIMEIVIGLLELYVLKLQTLYHRICGKLIVLDFILWKVAFDIKVWFIFKIWFKIKWAQVLLHRLWNKIG